MAEENPMNKGRHRTVYRRPDGMWVHECNDSQQPPRLLRTQREAVEEARWDLMTGGGGRLTIVGDDIESDGKVTASPGNGPSRPRGTKP